MTIQEILDNILHAVFGRDVRQSLHDGVKIANDICTETEKRQTELEKKYNEQIKNMTLESPSDAEIVDARIKTDGTIYETLGTRLNETDKTYDEVAGAKSKPDGTTYETLGDRLDATDAEIADARMKADGTTYGTLGERLNAIDESNTESNKALGKRLDSADSKIENAQTQITDLKTNITEMLSGEIVRDEVILSSDNKYVRVKKYKTHTEIELNYNGVSNANGRVEINPDLFAKDCLEVMEYATVNIGTVSTSTIAGLAMRRFSSTKTIADALTIIINCDKANNFAELNILDNDSYIENAIAGNSSLYVDFKKRILLV